MPLRFTRDDAKRRLVLKATEPLTFAEWLDAIGQHLDAGLWSYATVYDARAITWTPETSEVRQMVAFIEHATRTYGPRGPVALVIDGKDAQYGMARMYGILVDELPFSFKIFSDWDQAEAWLDEPDRE